MKARAASRRWIVLVPIAGTFVLTGPVSADFVGLSVNTLDLGAVGGTTYRVYAAFDNPADQLLAVSGNDDVGGFYFQTDTVLMNDGGPFAGLKPEDFAFLGAPWDSWVTIGASTFAGNDTDYSPGFVGSDGVTAVIRGSTLSQPDNGGWYDSNPGTPQDGGPVLIAQFTLADSATGKIGYFSMEGTIDYNPAGTPPPVSEFFSFALPGPGGLVLLMVFAVATRSRMRLR